jgi:hypothetical protein
MAVPARDPESSDVVPMAKWDGLFERDSDAGLISGVLPRGIDSDRR